MITLESIISALLFYLFPILIGRVAYGSINKNKEVSYPFVSYFVFGCLTIFGWALIEKYVVLSLFPTYSFIRLFQPTIYILGVLAFFINLTLIRNFFNLDIKKYLQSVLLSIFLGGIVYYLWNLNTPYPLNWDFLEHQTLVDNILRGRYSFVTSQISDTFIFNGYSSIFHTIMMSAQMLLPTAILDFWQSISFIHLVLVILASYFFAHVITNNESIALFSAILGTFVFETVTFTSLFFIPQTLTAVVFIFLFIQLLLEVKHNRLPSISFIIFNSLFLFLNHYIIGLLAVLIYVGLYLYIRYSEWLFAKINKIVLLEVGLFISVIMIIFSSLIPLNFLNQGEAEYFNFSVVEKFLFMQRAYGHSLLLFLPLGISKILKRRKDVEVITLVIALFILTLIFIQIPYVFKFYVIGRFFIHLIIAIGIFVLIEKVTYPLLINAIMIFLISVLIGIFIVNSVHWKNILNYKDILTHISPTELQAAEFLKNKYGKTNILLVSDPATQNILETFSGVNSQGGVYANQNTREQLMTIFQATAPVEIKDRLYLIKDALETTDEKRLFVLSGRYFQWQMASKKYKQALYFNIWTPSDLTFDNKKYINFLSSDLAHFALVYENPTVAIFEVNR